MPFDSCAFGGKQIDFHAEVYICLDIIIKPLALLGRFSSHISHICLKDVLFEIRGL